MSIWSRCLEQGVNFSSTVYMSGNYICKSSFIPNKRNREVDDVFRAYVEKRLSYLLFQLIAYFQDLVQWINSTLFRCSHDAYHANYRNFLLQLIIQNIK